MAAISSGVVSEALKRGKADRPPGPFRYIRFRESFRGIMRGTVITADGTVIRGYPHIKRIFTLENGLKKNMPAGVLYAEEKIDGFNVRIASLGGEVFAFSRGGFIDAFVTEKAREMKLGGFFGDCPEHVLCGEMIGNTPYTKPTNEFDVRLYIFDIDRGDGTHLPPEERYETIEKYGMLGVPKLGKFKSDDYAGMKKAILSLNKGRKEGMVLKSADRKSAVKYVTPWSDIEDIGAASKMLADMPIGFYYQRVLRSAFFMEDFGFDRGEYARKLGDAFYGGLVKAIEAVKAGREIDEEFEIRVKDPAIWDDVRHHMSKDVKLEKLWEREDNGKIRIRFRKIYKKTTKLLASYANGKGIED